MTPARPAPARFLARFLACTASALVTCALVASRALAQAPAVVAVAPLRVTVTVVDQATGRPLAGALVHAATTGGRTDSAGVVRLALPAGAAVVVASRVGFAADSLRLTLGAAGDTALLIALRPAAGTLAPVVVTSTRGSRRIEDEPTRIEVLAGEDVGEKTVMRPANPTTLLTEVPGVRVQTTSPSLGGAGLRLQGLRGRYTLLLADGLPSYGASSEGLGFLQIPPLDLAQAEVIKGPASALYGPAAAGGVVNFVSRRPPADGRGEHELLLNQTTRQGSDVLGWSTGRLSPRWGYSLLAGAHRQTAMDVDGDRWADLPGYRRAEARPRLFWTGAGGATALVTAGGAVERREAGTVDGGAVPGGGTFRVGADTRRADVGVVAHAPLAGGRVLGLRASASTQAQHRQFGDSLEADHRGSSLAEVTLAGSTGAHEWVAGVAADGDALSGARVRDASYHYATVGVLAQDTYAAGERTSVTASARVDRHSRFGTLASPRLSALVRLGHGVSARASAAAGAFAPTSLVEAADAVGLARVRGLASLSAERLRQAAFDLNGRLGALELNGSLFASRIAHAVVVRENRPNAGELLLTNAPTPTRTGGAEFYATYNVEPVAVTALYSYTRATEWSADKARRVDAPLVPRHAAGLDVAFEEDESGTRVGVETFYVGRQAVDDDPYRTVTRPYVTVGVLASQALGPVTLFVNAENLTDVRQTRFDPLLLPARSRIGAWTTDQWAPLEGRTVNAGLRLTL